ncbi:MAG TPA: dephospho-CoA kinase [Candidatus Acidoferrales bacterium]|nr:dephospho-CoA kinase [Candidatus Acidoferrales bacterium]
MIVGLTGGMGSGKTTVAALFAQKGAIVIDTDVIAREVVAPPSALLDALKSEFGPGVVGADGRLDRAALARLIFNDDDKRAKLNALMHPAILKRVLSGIGAAPSSAIVIVVVPLLFESRFELNCDRVVAVVASPELRRQRIAERDGFTPTEIEARMRAQLPESEYEQRADVVIRNDGNLTALGREVDKAWAKINDPAGRKPRRAAGKP